MHNYHCQTSHTIQQKSLFVLGGNGQTPWVRWIINKFWGWKTEVILSLKASSKAEARLLWGQGKEMASGRAIEPWHKIKTTKRIMVFRCFWVKSSEPVWDNNFIKLRINIYCTNLQVSDLQLFFCIMLGRLMHWSVPEQTWNYRAEFTDQVAFLCFFEVFAVVLIA